MGNWATGIDSLNIKCVSPGVFCFFSSYHCTTNKNDIIKLVCYMGEEDKTKREWMYLFVIHFTALLKPKEKYQALYYYLHLYPEESAKTCNCKISELF